MLLREYELEMEPPSANYRNDHSKKVVQLTQPAWIHYRHRKTDKDSRAITGYRVMTDLDLCQRHAIYELKALDYFRVPHARQSRYSRRRTTRESARRNQAGGAGPVPSKSCLSERQDRVSVAGIPRVELEDCGGALVGG